MKTLIKDAAWYEPTKGNFSEFMEILTEKFQENIIGKDLFHTDGGDLWPVYLYSVSEEVQQEYNCTCCKNFIRKFGDIVIIDELGKTSSPLWDISADYGFFNDTVTAMADAVSKRMVSGVFLSKEKTLGVKNSGGWEHFYITLPNSFLYKDQVNTAKQGMAEKREDYRIVSTGITKFTNDVVSQGLKLAKSGALSYSDRVEGSLTWLKQLHDNLDGKHKYVRSNIIWKAIASAPKGFAHITSNVASTLLEDIEAGMDFETVSARFSSKAKEDVYMRPTEAPSCGNVRRADLIVEKLGIKPSFQRRYAKLEELERLWSPQSNTGETKTDASMFAHLETKGSPKRVTDLNTPPVKITWDKFSRKVLPEAVSISLVVPSRGNFIAFTTAVNADAPNILRWDNTVSAYCYTGGSYASHWNMTAGDIAEVTCITHKPSHWKENKGKTDHGTDTISFIINGCKESRPAQLCLFPETLKSELHEVRSTIESFSQNGKLEGLDDATACGVAGSVMIHVTDSMGLVCKYHIDRMD